jgi:hypothetical protein
MTTKGHESNSAEAPFPITTSLEEAAEEILTHSFAIYKVPSEVRSDIRDAWGTAASLLDGPPLKDCQRIINGHLHGFNTPSNAKKIFRAFSSQDQPWPTRRFESSSEKIAEALHAILVACCTHIMASNKGESSRKRQKISSSRNITVPSSWKSTTTCPLDYFFYHNQHRNAINCSEHVDRGLLICVCLTNVPGLEVQSRCTGEFFCPEERIHQATLYKEMDHPTSDGWICIMAGDQLSERIGKEISCVHRVRNQLKRARLSISYELRI